MAEIPRPADHPAIRTGKIGVLLVNLGTTEGTSYWPMRRYLKEFLSDPRVIETNRILWWFILNVIILTIRPAKSGHAYAQIWNHELDESPLKTFTRAQAEKCAAALDHGDVIVDWAMRYGQPSIAERLSALKDAGCDRILIMPLYPQYSATTTASVFDKAAEAMRQLRWQPTLRFAPPFFDQADYIDALAKTTGAFIEGLDWQPDKILLSYHGLPQSYVDAGDPYYCQCLKTTRLLVEKMDWPDGLAQATFQSRVGRQEWVKPYTDETVRTLAQGGTKNLLILSPAFISDCVETLEELAIGVAEEFKENGGKNIAVAPCLNDSPEAIDFLAAFSRREIAGWIG